MTQTDFFNRAASALAALCTKRTVLAVALALTAVISAGAQKGLGVDNVFRRFGHSKGCKMVEMHNVRLHGYQLKTYKSITYRNSDTAIESCLKADKAKAGKIREVVEDGRVVSGYYMMPPEDGTNRYVLFAKEKKSGGTVIYIEGKLSPDDIMKLCFSRK